MPTLNVRRHFFVGLNSGFVTEGLPDNRCCEFYARRGGHGLYCSIVGNVVIPGGVAPNDSSPVISNDPAWSTLAKAVGSMGALPGIQLSTTWLDYSGRRTFVSRSSSDEILRYKEIANSVSKEDVRRIFSALSAGTDLAIRAGFRHVQLHAAHGYLFSLLVDSRIYPHASDVIEKITGWAKAVRSCGIETSLRFSLKTGDPAFDETNRHVLLNLMSELPVDYLDVSSGFYDIDKRLIYPSLERLLQERRRETLALANSHPDAKFIYSGKSIRGSEEELPDNVHIGICRDLIANPEFLQSRNMGCTNMMKCHWYSRGKRHLECGHWANN